MLFVPGMAMVNAAGGALDLERPFRSALVAGSGKLFWDVASRSLSFALSVLVARKLGASAFGSFAVFWYTAFLLAQLTDLGVHLLTLRALSREESPSAFPPAVLSKVALSLVLAVGFAGWSFTATTSRGILFLLLAAQLASSWVEFFGVVLRSRGFLAREGSLLTTLRAGWLLAALLALSRSTDLRSFAGLLALSSLPALALAFLMVARLPALRRQGSLWSARRETLRWLGRALPLGLGSAVTLLYLRADLLILGALRDTAEAGNFQGAFRLFEATFVLSGAVAAGTFPLLASRLGQKGFDALVRFVLGFLVILVVPITLGFSLLGGWLVPLLYGEGFSGAVRPLAILGVALLAVFPNALTTHLLVAAGRTRRFVAALLVRLSVSVGLDLLLVPSLGAVGAAVAVAAAEWSLLLVSLYSVTDLLGWSSVARPTLSREETAPCS